MHAYAGLVAFLQASLSSPAAEALAIAIAVLFQEDVTAVIVGMMAADRLVPPPVAVISLIVGELVNDFGLYGIGRLAITHPGLRRWVEHEKRLPLRSRLNTSLIPTVAAVQFMPGLRLPIYIACGFFSLSFRRFAVGIVPAVAVWTLLVFFCSYFYGEYAANLFGLWEWPIAIVFIVGVGFAARASWGKLNDRVSRGQSG